MKLFGFLLLILSVAPAYALHKEREDQVAKAKAALEQLPFGMPISVLKIMLAYHGCKETQTVSKIIDCKQYLAYEFPATITAIVQFHSGRGQEVLDIATLQKTKASRFQLAGHNYIKQRRLAAIRSRAYLSIDPQTLLSSVVTHTRISYPKRSNKTFVPAKCPAPYSNGKFSCSVVDWDADMGSTMLKLSHTTDREDTNFSLLTDALRQMQNTDEGFTTVVYTKNGRLKKTPTHETSKKD